MLIDKDILSLIWNILHRNQIEKLIHDYLSLYIWVNGILIKYNRDGYMQKHYNYRDYRFINNIPKQTYMRGHIHIRDINNNVVAQLSKNY